MDIQQLRYFVEIARLRSFSKAAVNLRVSQPALSKTIKNIEEEIGIEVFDRRKKTIELTDCGESLLEVAQKALRQFDDIYESINDTMHLKKGRVIVGIPPVIGTTYFATIITEFKKKYPGIELEIIEEGAKTITSQVMEGNISIGIVISPIFSEDLDFIPVMKNENVCVVNKLNPLSKQRTIHFQDLRNESFCIFNEHFLLHNQIIARCREAGFEPEITFTSSQWDFIMEMIACNQGVSILPKPIASKAKYPNVKILPIVPVFPWEIVVITKKDKYLSFAIREFIQHVRNCFDAID